MCYNPFWDGDKMNKSVLITGACGGMGNKTAKLLAEKGYTVFGLDKNLCESSENIIPIQADITNEESVINAFSLVCSRTDNLCAIIHFAGIYMLDSLVEMESESFKKIFDINVTGVYLINKIFLPLIKKDGRIIITTSELAPLKPLPFTGIYAVTKGALDKYAFSLCMELQLLGIHVSVLRAGAVSTAMIKESTDALENFCNKTKLYFLGGNRFRDIVNKVEARSVLPEKISRKVMKILQKPNPAFHYSINRNPLLLMFNLLPEKLQLKIIKSILIE